MKTVAIIQARLGSSRLPRKVLMDIAGVPMLTRIIQRSAAAPGVDEVVVATTTEPEDDALAAFAETAGTRVFRGSVDDVLSRYHDCAAQFGAERVVRVTADDPLKDPEVIGRAIGYLNARPHLDYCSNTMEPTYPEGLDIEAFTFAALARAHREARLPSEREHVTPYIWKHPDLFNTLNFRFDRDLSDWRWTVDKPADMEFMQRVFGHFRDEPLVSFRDVITWLENNPEVRGINAGTIRNEGYKKSIATENP
jgi:spore coat polysaccharide biosynthesis protein SpsF